MTPNQVFKKANEKEVYSNFQDRRVRQQPKSKLGHCVRTTDIKRVFSKRDCTNYSYNLYPITENIHDYNPSYKTDFLPESYNENLLLPSKLSPDENNKVMDKINLIQ